MNLFKYLLHLPSFPWIDRLKELYPHIQGPSCVKLESQRGKRVASDRFEVGDRKRFRIKPLEKPGPPLLYREQRTAHAAFIVHARDRRKTLDLIQSQALEDPGGLIRPRLGEGHLQQAVDVHVEN